VPRRTRLRLRDQGAGVDRPGIDTGELVLLSMKRPRAAASIVVPSAAFSTKGVSSTPIRDDLALGHDVAVVEAFEHQTREDQVRSGRTDIDPDAGETYLVFGLEAAPDVAEEGPAAGSRSFQSRTTSWPAGVPARVHSVSARRSSRAFPRIPCGWQVLHPVGNGGPALGMSMPV